MTGGRFVAAIASLGAAALASCAPRPPPKRVAPAAAEQEAEEAEEREPACGPPAPRPTVGEQRHELASTIGTASINCAFRVANDGRHGEVRVTLVFDGGLVRVDAKVMSSLEEDDRLCIETAARSAARPAADWKEALAKPLTMYLTLGQAVPLLPYPQKLLAEWREAARAAPVRKRFAAALPDEVSLDDDGCLRFPERPIFVDGIERWLAKLETPLDPFWQPGSRGSAEYGEYGLFAGMRPQFERGARAYLIDDGTLLLYLDVPTSSGERRLCLLNFDDTVRQELQARIDERGTCWVGDLRETLLHPRTGVPAGRRFRTVAAELTRICAIDERGERICCGERLPKPPAPSAYARVSGNAARSCAVGEDGTVGCDRPWPVAPTPPLRNPAVLGMWSSF